MAPYRDRWPIRERQADFLDRESRKIDQLLLESGDRWLFRPAYGSRGFQESSLPDHPEDSFLADGEKIGEHGCVCSLVRWPGSGQGS